MSSTTKCQSGRPVVKRRSLLFGAGVAAAMLAPRTFAAMPGGFTYHLDREGNAISVRLHGQEVDRMESLAPAAIAVHPNGRFVYVVNAVGEYEFLPRGTVESHAVADGGRTLHFLARTPLSLSATFPSDIAMSPDGRHAVVAIAGGGAYNVLPVATGSGVLQAPSQIVKRYGVVPERVAFDPSGRTLFGGAGEIFGFENGLLQLHA